MDFLLGSPFFCCLFANIFNQSSEILPCPDNRYRMQKVSFLRIPGDHLVNVFIFNHIELVGQTHFGVGFLDPADEGIGLFCIVSSD